MTIKDIGPKPQSFNIEHATKENTNYRSVAWSGRYLQVTLMSIPVGGDIGLEAHPETDQFLRLDAGRGRVQMGAAKDKLTFEKEVSDGWWCACSGGSLAQHYQHRHDSNAGLCDLCARPSQAWQGARDGGGGRSRQRRRAGGVVSAAKTCTRQTRVMAEKPLPISRFASMAPPSWPFVSFAAVAQRCSLSERRGHGRNCES
ncbi:mannose-6-phosphate isomerase-like protein (cupin superfamily) [Bradyrhizobium diazoefficiens]